MIDFERQRLRSRLEAKLLAGSAEDRHRRHGAERGEVIESMGDVVVELGPGVGANMRYYRPGQSVIAIEPNPHYHDGLRAEARRHGVDIDIRALRGERIDVTDGTADGVVATLVLCGVDQPTQVLEEIRRILRPGGTYLFHEHVAGETGGRLLRAQRLLRRPHSWLFNGCDPARDIEPMIRDVGFASVVSEEVDAGPGALHCRRHIVGVATQP